MPVKLQPTSVIKTRLGIQSGGPIHKFFTNECYKAMDEFVPRSAGTDGGSLRETVSIEVDKIIYESPYARYQYHGMREDGSHVVKHYTTPGTGPYWDKRMWSVKKENVLQAVQDEINRRGSHGT